VKPKLTVGQLFERLRDLLELEQIGAAVGLDREVNAYPASDAIRDAGQQRLLERLHALVPSHIHWRTEVPLPDDGDRRAWDAVIRGDGWFVPIEAETVLRDVQAVERRVSLKVRDGHARHVLLLVADTRRNRRALEAAPASFAGFDRRARPVLTAIRAGADPGRSAILFL